MKETRLDRSHSVSYPSSPDKRGSARVNLMRRNYYLGPHESPLSYVMFGIWKNQIQLTGSAPSTAEIRPLAEQLLSDGANAVKRARRVRLLAGATGLLACAALIVGLNFRSTLGPPAVDGLVLTQDEMEFVRGIRRSDEAYAKASVGKVARVVSIAKSLMEEGGSNYEARHTGRTLR